MNEFMKLLPWLALLAVGVAWGILFGQNYRAWRMNLQHGCVHCDHDAHPFNWRALIGPVLYHEWLSDQRTAKYRKGYE